MSLQPQELTARVLAEVRRLSAGEAGERELLQVMRLLAKWRSLRLDTAMDTRGPNLVPHGPFAGMIYSVRAAEGARLPRRLGIYEASLAPVIEAIIARGYPLVIDIGAAEGYYAVGLARRMPHSRILARDGNPVALDLCRKLAADNGVGGRIELGGVMSHADFAICAATDSVVICDIEGAEGDLLDPETAPGLRHADILVEVHEGMRPGLLDLLARRFAPTHDVTRIDRKLDDTPVTGWMEQLPDLDRLLLMWEWRASATPWLWMTRK